MAIMILTKMLIDKPVMSLRNGRKIAITRQAIINPNNLKIEGFYCNDSIEKKKAMVLVSRDIRDVLPAGIVVNDYDVFAMPDELPRLKKVLDWDFILIGKNVYTEHKKKLGRVGDYAVEPSSMMVKKIYVTQSLVRNFAGGSLSIDRNQIIEVTQKKIVVKDPLQPKKINEQIGAAEPLLAT